MTRRPTTYPYPHFEPTTTGTTKLPLTTVHLITDGLPLLLLLFTTGWHKCWAHNSAADDSTQNHDLGFEALSTKDTFKDEVGKLTKMVCTSFGIPETEIDLDAIVESVTKDDFHEELNPMLSNGNQKATLVATATATTGAREKVKWRLMGNH